MTSAMWIWVAAVAYGLSVLVAAALFLAAGRREMQTRSDEIGVAFFCLVVAVFWPLLWAFFAIEGALSWAAKEINRRRGGKS